MFTVALEFDPPAIGGYGTCTRDIDACPTGTVVAPFEIHAPVCLPPFTPISVSRATGEARLILVRCHGDECPGLASGQWSLTSGDKSSEIGIHG